MACRVLGTLLRGGASMGGPPDGHAFVFIFFFTLERSLSICGPLEGLLARFRKTPINSVHPSLDITIQFADKKHRPKVYFR